MINLLEGFVEGVKDSNTQELQFMLNHAKFVFNSYSMTLIFLKKLQSFVHVFVYDLLSYLFFLNFFSQIIIYNNL